MNRLLNKIARVLQWLLPSPFTLAVLLLAVTYFFAVFGAMPQTPFLQRNLEAISFFEKGIWSLLPFAMQMALMLLLGYVIALSDVVKSFITVLTKRLKNTAQAALWIGFFTLFFSYLNWALGLIFGAILASEVAQQFSKERKPFNYPLIAAAGYVGLMVWHGGLSGSAPLKIAEQGHFLQNKIGVINIGQTIFSSMNLFVISATLIVVPLFLYWIGKKVRTEIYHLAQNDRADANPKTLNLQGAERLDYSRGISLLFVLFLFGAIVLKLWNHFSLSVFTINYLNLILLATALLVQKNFNRFLSAVGQAIGSTAGILIQFPIYAGIMGIMRYSGLIDIVTAKFIELATPHTFNFLVFLSAGMVNFVVPSGGGQWIIQGALVVDAAKALHLPVSQSVMAFAYGDQLTNMLQPFWALPLLGITGLKAKQIFPYTFLLLIIGFLIFTTAIFLF